jgi:hypothetical protein
MFKAILKNKIIKLSHNTIIIILFSFYKNFYKNKTLSIYDIINQYNITPTCPAIVANAPTYL